MMNPLLKIKLLLKYSRKEGQNVAAGNRRVSYLFKRVFQIEIQQVHKIKFLNFHCKQQQQHRRIRNLACEKSDLEFFLHQIVPSFERFEEIFELSLRRRRTTTTQVN